MRVNVAPHPTHSLPLIDASPVWGVQLRMRSKWVVDRFQLRRRRKPRKRWASPVGRDLGYPSRHRTVLVGGNSPVQPPTSQRRPFTSLRAERSTIRGPTRVRLCFHCQLWGPHSIEPLRQHFASGADDLLYVEHGENKPCS